MNDFLQMRRAALLLFLPLYVFGCNDTPQPSVENAANVVAPPASTRTSSAPSTMPSGTPQKTAATLFLPDGDGNLKRVVIKNALPPSAGDTPSQRGKTAQQVVELLMKKMPRGFPQGTRVLDATQFQSDEKTVALNFNQALVQDNFWHGETKTESAIYAVVNTVAQSAIGAKKTASEPMKVRFLVEGKPLQTLGEFDLSDPIEPDMTLVAKP